MLINLSLRRLLNDDLLLLLYDFRAFHFLFLEFFYLRFNGGILFPLGLNYHHPILSLLLLILLFRLILLILQSSTVLFQLSHLFPYCRDLLILLFLRMIHELGLKPLDSIIMHLYLIPNLRQLLITHIRDILIFNWSFWNLGMHLIFQLVSLLFYHSERALNKFRLCQRLVPQWQIFSIQLNLSLTSFSLKKSCTWIACLSKIIP